MVDKRKFNGQRKQHPTPKRCAVWTAREVAWDAYLATRPGSPLARLRLERLADPAINDEPMARDDFRRVYRESLGHRAVVRGEW